MHAFLQLLRRVIPSPIFRAYHRTLSFFAAAWYAYPSEKLVVIGITGTSGKTTTCYLLAKLLEAEGAKVGCTTTAFFKVAEKEWANDTKMTMLGRFQLQKMLRTMVDAGCTYAIIETSSQGVVQSRHRHVAYDVCVFTNLTPEHIEAHGGFENYKQAKVSFFRDVAALPPKTLNDRTVPRIAVLNAANEHAESFAVQGFNPIIRVGAGHDLHAEAVQSTSTGSTFRIGETAFQLNMLGGVMVENALMAIATAEALGVRPQALASALKNIHGLPGHYERISAGQPFTVLVDFAFEPNALTKLYDAVEALPHKRIIHLLGSAGGGRDVQRRAVLGDIAGTNADIVIVTNEDPYDDDPQQIINDVAEGARHAGKRDNETLFCISDRRDAIQKAISLAQPNDIVLLTGKGSEPVMAVSHGRRIPWSDADEAKKAISAIIRS